MENKSEKIACSTSQASHNGKTPRKKMTVLSEIGLMPVKTYTLNARGCWLKAYGTRARSYEKVAENANHQIYIAYDFARILLQHYRISVPKSKVAG